MTVDDAQPQPAAAPPRITKQQARIRNRRLSIQQVGPQKVPLNAAFDYAESNPELNEVFARALHESGLTSFDRETRRRLVDRSRYEILQANEWFKGSARQAVNWVIGRGPFLEVKLEGNSTAARQVERQFNQWFRSVDGARKMRVMQWAKITDGSGYAMVTNKAVAEGSVSLNFVPFEEEQIAAPVGSISGDDWNTQYLLDGIELDSQNDPIAYHVLPAHPADEFSLNTRRVPAEYVIAVWQWERPSQRRGYPELATSIGKGPMMRIYDRAVIDAAATAAKHTVLVETNVDTFGDGDVAYDPVDPDVQMQIGYGMQTFLPAGHKATQLKPEQPTASHEKFTRTNVAAAARPLGQPAQIATGDSAGMNFAGGQLGRQDYELDVDVQRQDWETHCLDKLLRHFLDETVLLGLIPAAIAAEALTSHEWRWTRRRHQDTNREYTGRQKACQSGLTSPAFWQEDDGVDPEEEDIAAARSYGITVEQFREARFRTLFPEASMAILGPGLSAAPTTGRPPGDQTNAP
jgi:capsid protein